MATKQVIVLQYSTDGLQIYITAAFWFPITTGMRPVASGSSWVASGTSAGASSVENTAILNGSIYEEIKTVSFAASTPPSAMQANLQILWSDRQAQIAGNGNNIYYGWSWDGTTWLQS